jgi:hypothetical protein
LEWRPYKMFGRSCFSSLCQKCIEYVILIL